MMLFPERSSFDGQGKQTHDHLGRDPLGPMPGRPDHTEVHNAHLEEWNATLNMALDELRGRVPNYIYEDLGNLRDQVYSYLRG
jgi:hypothetical protein